MTIKQNDKETNSTIKEISETAEKKISQKTGQPAPLTSTTNIKNTQPIFEEKPTTAEQNYIIEKETYFAPITKQGGVGIASNSTSKLLLIASQHQEECAITPISLRKRGLNQNNAFLLPGHCVNTECSPFSGNTPYFSVSLWGSTALFIEGNKTQDTKLINWMSLELDLTYHKGNLFFTTGLGAVYSTDQSKITYDYLQNELIDSYIYVDSVYYDPITGTTQYYTTTVNVYDSIEHADQSQYNNHYKYIKIPFNVGYEVYKNQYIGISLSGGISWIHQINTQAKIPIIQKENSRILQTHFNEIIRNKDLFQLSAQLAMNINLSRRVNLQFGLGYHYFTQPLYQNQTVKNPVSWSMGTGIQYKF